MPKPVVPRELANRDVDEAIAHYLREADERVVLSFVDALERAYRHIGRHPESGSPRYALELKLPGLRAWPLGRFPYIVFYIETRENIDVWRMLHGARDIPAWMQARAPTKRLPHSRTLPISRVSPRKPPAPETRRFDDSPSLQDAASHQFLEDPFELIAIERKWVSVWPLIRCVPLNRIIAKIACACELT